MNDFNSSKFQGKNKLNVLPDNPESSLAENAVSMGRFPSWLHLKLPKGKNLLKTHSILETHRMPTVCEEAKCPNLFECYSQKTATFLAMGKTCTRACGFCSINFSKKPSPLEEDEPDRLAKSVRDLGLRHVVITMVARDDLEDGGASHLAKIIAEVRKQNPAVTVEVLTSDFEENEESIQIIIEAKPEIFNHNIETVRELTPKVRHKATYDRTLNVLKKVASSSRMLVKSGLMLGLGETHEQVIATLQDLAAIPCNIVTIGQYLQPDHHKIRVKAFIPPQQFEEYAITGKKFGIQEVYAGPFVRSSYNAKSVFDNLCKNYG